MYSTTTALSTTTPFPSQVSVYQNVPPQIVPRQFSDCIEFDPVQFPIFDKTYTVDGGTILRPSLYPNQVMTTDNICLSIKNNQNITEILSIDPSYIRASNNLRRIVGAWQLDIFYMPRTEKQPLFIEQGHLLKKLNIFDENGNPVAFDLSPRHEEKTFETVINGQPQNKTEFVQTLSVGSKSTSYIAGENLLDANKIPGATTATTMNPNNPVKATNAPQSAGQTSSSNKVVLGHLLLAASMLATAVVNNMS